MRSLLAIDVGNTLTTLGLFEGERLAHRWRMTTRVARTSDEIWVFLRQFMQTSSVTLERGCGVSISSVVPDRTDAFARMAVEKLQMEPLVIGADKVHSLKIEYDPPSSVGADRLCGAVAAFKRFGGPVVIVDLGTATVFDVVSREGVYLGGVIAPGLASAVESLHRSAALLPQAEVQFPPDVIGATTEAAIQSGVLYGTVEMIDGLVDRIRGRVPGDLTVLATGGFAELIHSRSRTIGHVLPDLVLEGIRLITDEQP